MKNWLPNKKPPDGPSNGPRSAPCRRCARALALCAGLALFPTLLAGCAAVEPYEREMLADPILDAGNPMAKQSLESKFFSTREGSFGGGGGVGGGCGCAK